MNFRQQLQEAYKAGYESALNEQDVYKRPAKVSALGGQKFHAIVDNKGVIVAAGLTEKEARKKRKFGQTVLELPGAKVGQVFKKEAYEAGYRSGLNESNGTFGGGTPPTPPVPGNLPDIIRSNTRGAVTKQIRAIDDIFGSGRRPVRPVTKRESDIQRLLRRLRMLDDLGLLKTPPPGGSSPI